MGRYWGVVYHHRGFDSSGHCQEVCSQSGCTIAHAGWRCECCEQIWWYSKLNITYEIIWYVFPEMYLMYVLWSIAQSPLSFSKLIGYPNAVAEQKPSPCLRHSQTSHSFIHRVEIYRIRIYVSAAWESRKCSKCERNLSPLAPFHLRPALRPELPFFRYPSLRVFRPYQKVWVLLLERLRTMRLSQTISRMLDWIL